MERYLVGMLAGIALAVAVGYTVVTVRDHRAVSPPPQPVPTLAEHRAQVQREFDGRMTKSANDTTLLPEVRVDALAAKVMADGLFALDTRFGTNESEIYVQQESEHWHRVIEALPHPHPKHDRPPLTELLRHDLLAGNYPGTAEVKGKLDALIALDTLLGTDETSIFVQQELDRSDRVLRAMEAPRK